MRSRRNLNSAMFRSVTVTDDSRGIPVDLLVTGVCRRQGQRRRLQLDHFFETPKGREPIERATGGT
jgi:hypothetical protein